VDRAARAKALALGGRAERRQRAVGEGGGFAMPARGPAKRFDGALA
jgi:hypothetical protein